MRKVYVVGWSSYKGLKNHGGRNKPRFAKRAYLPENVTVFRAVPNGTERGDFLALDLGGTNFRVLLIKLKGDVAEMTGKVYRIPEETMKGAGTVLFDHIGECLADFLGEHDLKDSKGLPLGFTFSFPVQQEDLTTGKLNQLDQRIQCKRSRRPSMLFSSFVMLVTGGRDISIDVVALLNDTVGTLMACAFKDNSCQIGVILGTGTNACYMEKLSNCPKFKKFGFDKDKYPKENLTGTLTKHPSMRVNICKFPPWHMSTSIKQTATGNMGHVVVQPSIKMSSLTENIQSFEKMISGMYLGELVRLVLVKLAKDKMLFDGDYEAISKPDCFPTKFVSDIEEQKGLGDFRRTLQILQQIGINKISDSDCLHVAYVCEVISTRTNRCYLKMEVVVEQHLLLLSLIESRKNIYKLQ
uniref:Phosphotransferase n=1 Tax=Setaria cervi TaxID=65603 RepID=Q56VN5_SETCE|nr:hexokinase [Setaria cervi]